MSEQSTDNLPENPTDSKDTVKKHHHFPSLHLPYIPFPHLHYRKKEKDSDDVAKSDNEQGLSSPDLGNLYISDDNIKFEENAVDSSQSSPDFSDKGVRMTTGSISNRNTLDLVDSFDSATDNHQDHLSPSSSSSKIACLSTHKSTRKTFFTSLFGSKKTKQDKRKRSIDQEAAAAVNPDLCLSLQYEQENFYITVAVVGGMIIPFIGYVFLFWIQFILSWTIYYGRLAFSPYSSEFV
jgi:hypothetical protein